MDQWDQEVLIEVVVDVWIVILEASGDKSTLLDSFESQTVFKLLTEFTSDESHGL